MSTIVGTSHVFPVGLRVVVSRLDLTTTILFEGEFDLAGKEAVRDAIRNALASEPVRLVLDLSGLSFIDSSGLQVVIETTASAAEGHVDLSIVPGPAAVQRVFEICGATEILPFTHHT